MQVLLEAFSEIITNDLLQKYPTLRMYLQSFTRTSRGGFITKATCEVINGKKMIDEADIVLSWQDWAFNEHSYSFREEDGTVSHELGDAGLFYEEHPEGPMFKYRFLCEI